MKMTLTLVANNKRLGPVDVLNQQVMNRVAGAVATGAALMETAARRNAPRLKGDLARSITRIRMDGGRLWWKVGVPKDSLGGPYAITTEFGKRGRPAQPYLVPAAESTRAAYHELLRKALVDATESVR